MKLKNSEFKKILVFKHYYNTLSDYDKVKIRDNIIKKCGFSLPTFYYKNKNDNYPFNYKQIQKTCLAILNFPHDQTAK
jgi:hypothetical protein